MKRSIWTGVMDVLWQTRFPWCDFCVRLACRQCVIQGKVRLLAVPEEIDISNTQRSLSQLPHFFHCAFLWIMKTHLISVHHKEYILFGIHYVCFYHNLVLKYRILCMQCCVNQFFFQELLLLNCVFNYGILVYSCCITT